MKTYRIESDRLVLRCYEPKDAYLFKRSIDESLDHLRPWMTWAMDEPESLEKKIARLRKYRGEYDLAIDFTLGIFSKDGKSHIGSTGLHMRAGEHAREIGYWLSSKNTGQGFALETVKSLIKVAFEIENISNLKICCDPKNLSSRAIPEKLGFTHQETLLKSRIDSYGDKIDSMIWTLSREHYYQSDLPAFLIKAFDIIGKPIEF